MKAKPKTPRPTRSQRALARRIAGELFTSARGDEGDVLVLSRRGPLNDFLYRGQPPGRPDLSRLDLAQWTPGAVADLIAGRLAGEGQ